MHTQTVMEELLERYGQLVGSQRERLVAMLLALGEIDRLKVAHEYGYGSIYTMLWKRFRVSESTALRQVMAARLIVRFPAIARYLADGRIDLGTLGLIRPVLEEATAIDTLERASDKTEHEVRVLVASMRPRPAIEEVVPPSQPAEQLDLEVATGGASRMEVDVAAPPRERVQPLDSEWSKVELMLPREALADLEEVRALLSNKMPCARSGQIVAEALKLAKSALLKQKCGAKKPVEVDAITDEVAAPAEADALVPNQMPDWFPAAQSAYVPVEIAGPVWERDEGKCTFVGRDGVVCGTNHQIEFQHIVPRAKGGQTTVANVTLHCRAHNQLCADRDFGRDFMDRRRTEGALTGHAADVASALKNLGYRKDESRQAVRVAIERGEQGTTFVELFKAALRVLAR